MVVKDLNADNTLELDIDTSKELETDLAAANVLLLDLNVTLQLEE